MIHAASSLPAGFLLETARRITQHHAASGGPLADAHPAPTDAELDAARGVAAGRESEADAEWTIAQEIGRRVARDAATGHRPKSACLGCWTAVVHVAAENIAEDGWPDLATVVQRAEEDLAGGVVQCGGPDFCDGVPQ